MVTPRPTAARIDVRSSHRIFAAAFGAIGLTCLAWVAIEIASVDIVVFRMAQSLESASLQPASLSIPFIPPELETAAARMPTNPGVREMLGVLHLRRMQNATDVEQATIHLVAALHARPTSPYAWAEVAQAGYLQGDVISSIETALSRAVWLGPSEPAVQRVVTDLGLALWPDLSASARASVERAVAAEMNRDPVEGLRIAQRRGRLAIACSHIPQVKSPDWNRDQVCQGREAS